MCCRRNEKHGTAKKEETTISHVGEELRKLLSFDTWWKFT